MSANSAPPYCDRNDRNRTITEAQGRKRKKKNAKKRVSERPVSGTQSPSLSHDSTSWSISRSQKPNDVDVNVDKARVIDAAAIDQNVDVLGLPAQRHSDAFHSSICMPCPVYEATGRVKGMSSSNPNLASNIRSRSKKRSVPACETSPTSTDANSPSLEPTLETTAKRTEINPPSKSSTKRSTLEDFFSVSPDVIKQAHDAFVDIRTKFRQSKSAFVFPSFIDFQRVGEDAVISVNVTKTVEEIIAASVAEESLKDNDVDLAEVWDEEDHVPKEDLARTDTNYALNDYLAGLGKINSSLNRINTYFDEGLRLTKRELEKEVEKELERVWRVLTWVWKEKFKRKTDEQVVNKTTTKTQSVMANEIQRCGLTSREQTTL